MGELSPHASGKSRVLGVGDFHQSPAKNIICHRCGKRGHFQSHCQTPSTDTCTVSKQSGTCFVGILDLGGGGGKTLVCHSSASGHKCALQNRHRGRCYSYSRVSV